MSLRETLRAALAAPVTNIIAQFGVTCLHRRGATQRRPDNTTRTSWSTIASPVVLLSALDEKTRLEVFGVEVRGTLMGVCGETAGVLPGDVLIPAVGPFLGRKFVVNGRAPNDIGTYHSLALEETKLPVAPGEAP